jgi:hypothetical protein
MKLPAVAIAAAFACGILLGQSHFVSRHATLPFLALAVPVVLLLLIAGLLLPELHAGDEISVLTEARLPLVYKDASAFDRRELLARQNIHVLATLRAA